jgi:DNA repair protein RecO (recombination protein O)
MRWTDQAIILNTHKFSETSAVVKLFSRQYGVTAGAVRGAFSKTNRGIYQQGNIVQATWSARLEEQLGNLHCELEESIAASVMTDQGRLLGMSAALALVEPAFAERDPHPVLYDHLYYLLQRLKHRLAWQEEYVRMELTLLAESGFGLELDFCVVTRRTDNLLFVSPKSGHAVCAEQGEPYKNKLLPLPAFLRNPESLAEPHDILNGLMLTGYFLEHRLLPAHHRTMPVLRGQLLRWLQKQEVMA